MKNDYTTEIVIYAVFLLIVLCLAWVFKSWSCQSRAEQMGIPFKYGIVTGCMIKPKGQDWVPLENYRVM